jgi:hypothetical protein
MALDHSQTHHNTLFQLIAPKIHMNWEVQLCKCVIQLTNIKQKCKALMSIRKDELVIINYMENIAKTLEIRNCKRGM